MRSTCTKLWQWHLGHRELGRYSTVYVASHFELPVHNYIDFIQAKLRKFLFLLERTPISNGNYYRCFGGQGIDDTVGS